MEDIPRKQTFRAGEKQKRKLDLTVASKSEKDKARVSKQRKTKGWGKCRETAEIKNLRAPLIHQKQPQATAPVIRTSPRRGAKTGP